MNRILEKKWFVCLFGIMLFLSLVRYKGFDSDAALYLLQVMNYLQPERFVNDVPFMFGNQDSFSIFSPVVSSMYKFLGVNCGGIVSTLITLVGWSIAAFFLIFFWSKRFGFERYYAVILLTFFILLVDKTYGSGNLFLPIMEPYLVARVLSEVFILGGLASFFYKNKYLSLIFFTISAMMHPLMGGWCFPLWLFYHFPKSRIPILAITLLAPLSGFLNIGKLDFYPVDWRPMYYAPSWDDFVAYAGLLVFWLLMYGKTENKLISKFSLCMFFVSLAGFYLQFASSFSAHMLFYQAQPFRVGWLSQVMVIPVLTEYLYERFLDDKVLTLKDISFIWIALCAVAQYQSFPILVAACVLILLPKTKKVYCIESINKMRMLVCAGLVFFVASAMVTNFVNLAIEQGVGDIDFAVKWIDFPTRIVLVEKMLLAFFVVFSLSQKRFWLALAFAYSFCNGNLKFLAIIAGILILVPNLNHTIKKILISLTVVYSFAEILSSLHQFNEIQQGPLETCPVLGAAFLVVLTILALWCAYTNWDSRWSSLPIFLTLLAFSFWNFFLWDGRDETQRVNERQMDAFYDEVIFPQIVDRGKILFAVDNEAPIQSRINFMTGAYADESIYVGEVFYKDQYMESNRRRAALLWGDSDHKKVTDFGKRMFTVYQNPDSMLVRVRYLCGAGEISHFATDYANMPLLKVDSVFLDVKQKYVWLYECAF